MLDYEQFKTEVARSLEEKIPSGYRVECGSVSKLNGMILDSISAVREDRCFYRIMYLNDLYELYLKGDSIDAIAEMILAQGTTEMNRDEMLFMDLADYEKVSDRICLKLINAEKNEKLLKECPHVRFLDLAAVFYVMMETENGNYQTILNHRLLETWNKDKKDIIMPACRNTRRLNNYEIMDMDKILEEMGQKPDPEKQNNKRMVSIGAESGHNGAIYMMDKKLLSGYAKEMNDDLLIIPSSIHEIIILPASTMKREDADRTIHDVNKKVLSEGEYLSDHSYLFLKDDGVVVM